jgi:hypothetical protein
MLAQAALNYRSQAWIVFSYQHSHVVLNLRRIATQPPGGRPPLVIQ